MNVYGITKGRIPTIKRALETGQISPTNGNGKYHNNKRVPEAVRDQILQHIERFPHYESHYCRRDAAITRRYLEPGLTISKMYAMFIEYQRENGLPEAEKWLFDDIFNGKYRNLS